MYTVKTKIARGGFSIVFATASPSKAVVHYFVAGTGGRQASGVVNLDGAGETFVPVDFPVLAVGVTDLEIEEAPASEGASRRRAATSAPAIVNAIISSILAAGGLTSGYANAAVRDHSLRWRNADVASVAPAGDFRSDRRPFVATG